MNLKYNGGGREKTLFLPSNRRCAVIIKIFGRGGKKQFNKKQQLLLLVYSFFPAEPTVSGKPPVPVVVVVSRSGSPRVFFFVSCKIKNNKNLLGPSP